MKALIPEVAGVVSSVDFAGQNSPWEGCTISPRGSQNVRQKQRAINECCFKIMELTLAEPWRCMKEREAGVGLTQCLPVGLAVYLSVLLFLQGRM